jgi:hypothetical protein
VRAMPVFPFDVHTRARGQVHFDGFGVGRRHDFQYRTRKRRPGTTRSSASGDWLAGYAPLKKRWTHPRGSATSRSG